MYEDNKDTTSDRIIERAVELWVRMMRKPKFDNGDTSSNSFMTVGLAGMLRDTQMADVHDYEDRLERFRTILVAKLKRDRDMSGLGLSPGEVATKKERLTALKLYREGDERYWSYRLERRLSCDYHPCLQLAEAAAEAGVPDSSFSWKTDVNISYPSEPEHVQVSGGYAASYRYHYPLSDGRWLICAGLGADAQKVLDAVERGEMAGVFEIETAA